MNDPIIITRNLSHLYQPGPLQRQALIDISLEIARGSLFSESFPLQFTHKVEAQYILQSYCRSTS